MRVRKKPWAANEVMTNERIIQNAAEFKGRWKEYFGNDNPIHLEIGCGKGKFINELSAVNEGINYIALERELHVIVSGARAARGNERIAFIMADAGSLSEYIGEGEIERIYINFCDPWHRKRKWAKRRLTHRNFLSIYETLFAGYGEVHFKTDNTKLFEFSLNEFSDKGWRLRNITLDLHNSDFEGNIMTEYEEKFDTNIYRCEAIYKEGN